LPRLLDSLYRHIPAGVGKGRKQLRLERTELRRVLEQGAAWAIGEGMGRADDLEATEEGGCFPGADPDRVSERAYARGADQLGTLGSGNHFAEVQYVDAILDEPAAAAFGLRRDQVVVMLHSGSRGLGHQVCTDSLGVMLAAASRYGIELPDRQLCCAPLRSPEGRDYLAAMSAAANYAFANRQVMTHHVRLAFAEAMGGEQVAEGIELLYDVCHNTAKFETFEIDGRSERVCVHRKGATRAFPPGHPDVPEVYREVGQPVLIPGDMGRYSYVLAGTRKAFDESFGSTCHGAGRRMSRHAAKRAARGRNLVQELAEQGVVVRAAGRSTVAEEMPEAYKDVADVVEAVELAGLARPVARLRPLGVVKG
jgi:tRNA-splicing ligase RtcB